MAATADFIYGGIFSAYVAMVFIGAYLMIRRNNRRSIINSEEHTNPQDLLTKKDN